LGEKEKISAYIALFLLLTFIFLLPKTRKFILFFLLWISLNLAAYAAYIPNYSYPSDNRYLLHSFIPLIGLLTFLSFDLSKKTKSKIPILVIIIWGIGNLYSSLLYQRNIVINRSLPSKRFFSQLKEYVPEFKNGALFYFYVPNLPKAVEHYNAGFGVAQMPETTAIAWRYGVDRYDLEIANTYEDLYEDINKNKISLDNVFTFIAFPDNLYNTSDKTRNLIENGEIHKIEKTIQSIPQVENSEKGSRITNQGITLPSNDISLLTSLEVKVKLTAYPFKFSNDNTFPIRLVNSNEQPGSLQDQNTRDLYINYRKWLDDYYKSSQVISSSSWRDLTEKNVLDQDKNTYWEADRIAWDKRNEYLSTELSKLANIGGIIYQNGPYSLTPTNFEIYISKDGLDYKKIKDVYVTDFSTREEAQKVIFPSNEGKFIKILFKTLCEVHQISELIILPFSFKI
jgi:hypothetical protein